MPHNNVLVHNGPHIQQWPHEIISPSDAIAIINCESTLCSASQRWNHLMMHLSEHVPIAQQCTIVLWNDQEKVEKYNKKMHILIIIHYPSVIYIYQYMYIKIHFIPRPKPLVLVKNTVVLPLWWHLWGERFFFQISSSSENEISWQEGILNTSQSLVPFDIWLPFTTSVKYHLEKNFMVFLIVIQKDGMNTALFTLDWMQLLSCQ